MPAMRTPHDTRLAVGLMVALSGAAGEVGYASDAEVARRGASLDPFSA
jgi:hypothetical protein